MFYFITSLAEFLVSLFIPKYFRNLFTHYLILNKEIEILKRQQKKRITFTHTDRIVGNLLQSYEKWQENVKNHTTRNFIELAEAIN